MACNCATNEQIEQLYKKYGEKKEATKGESLEYKVRNIIRKTMVGICCIFITPFIFLYVFYKAFDDDKRISVRKFFNISGKQIGSNVG